MRALQIEFRKVWDIKRIQRIISESWISFASFISEIIKYFFGFSWIIWNSWVNKFFCFQFNLKMFHFYFADFDRKKKNPQTKQQKAETKKIQWNWNSVNIRWERIEHEMCLVSNKNAILLAKKCIDIRYEVRWRKKLNESFNDKLSWAAARKVFC